MKNVAKCDSWCELQNPVNHRVLERKLRQKSLDRWHVCLSVMNARYSSTSRFVVVTTCGDSVSRAARVVHLWLPARGVDVAFRFSLSLSIYL